MSLFATIHLSPLWARSSIDTAVMHFYGYLCKMYIFTFNFTLLSPFLTISLFFGRNFYQKFNFIGWTAATAHETRMNQNAFFLCGQISILGHEMTHTRAIRHYNLYSCSLLLVMLNTFSFLRFPYIRIFAFWLVICQVLHNFCLSFFVYFSTLLPLEFSLVSSLPDQGAYYIKIRDL